ncbi:MAG: tRNA (adenosine(37)-N6)-threonylcarbamoyltransferase complex transferase subunit TsaD [Deltaproteobacteria bacterium]
MKILGIETSCDDTAAAVLEDGRILSSVVSSQDALHADYGGVVPELAARRHLEDVDWVVSLALERADTELGDLDALAVTRGPGLVGSLLVGLSVAQGIRLATGLPIVGINHLEGHALSPLIDSGLELPYLCMVVSGGHTSIYLVHDIGSYRELASTRDDSAGEAFDKGAKMLGLGYPGGRVIDELAIVGRADAIRFPRGRVRADSLAMSFSGLKTSLWDFLARTRREDWVLADVCASFQEAIVDVLVDRTMAVLSTEDVASVAVAGGVSANSRLRVRMQEEAEAGGVRVVFPSFALCTDNAAMIAYAAHRRLGCGLEGEELAAVSRLPLGVRA